MRELRCEAVADRMAAVTALERLEVSQPAQDIRRSVATI